MEVNYVQGKALSPYTITLALLSSSSAISLSSNYSRIIKKLVCIFSVGNVLLGGK